MIAAVASALTRLISDRQHMTAECLAVSHCISMELRDSESELSLARRKQHTGDECRILEKDPKKFQHPVEDDQKQNNVLKQSTGRGSVVDQSRSPRT